MFDGIREHSETSTIEKPATVRLAGPQDEDALYDLMMSLNDDNSFGIPFNPERVRDAIQKGTRRQGSIIGVIDGKKGEYGEATELAASVSLTLASFWYSDQWYLAEQWLFVRPDYRSNHFDRDLFQFAKWSRDEMKRQGSDDILLVTSVSSPKRLAAKLRLWSRHARQIGGIFVID